MNATTRRFLTSLLLVAALGGATLASGTYTAHVAEPFVIGNQVFPGGEITLRAVGQGSLVSIAVNGSPVALVFRDQIGLRTGCASTSLVFQRDPRGFDRLVSVRHEDPSHHRSEERPLVLAALSEGLATVPPLYPAVAMTEARARR